MCRLPPGTLRPTIYKWMFQLDDEPNMYIENGWKSANIHENKWLALGFQVWICKVGIPKLWRVFFGPISWLDDLSGSKTDFLTTQSALSKPLKKSFEGSPCLKHISHICKIFLTSCQIRSCFLSQKKDSLLMFLWQRYAPLISKQMCMREIGFRFSEFDLYILCGCKSPNWISATPESPKQSSHFNLSKHCFENLTQNRENKTPFHCSLSLRTFKQFLSHIWVGRYSSRIISPNKDSIEIDSLVSEKPLLAWSFRGYHHPQDIHSFPFL